MKRCVDEGVAYHEAGHVVAAWDAGFPVRFSTAIPGTWEGRSHDGYTDSATESDCRVPGDQEHTLRNMKALLIQTLAGEMAEARAMARELHREDQDYDDAHHLVAEYGLCLKEAEEETKLLLDRRWFCVELVADALLAAGALNAARLEEIHEECRTAGANRS